MDTVLFEIRILAFGRMGNGNPLQWPKLMPGELGVHRTE
jgi:hypothetical protein